MDTNAHRLIGTYEQQIDRQGRMSLPDVFAESLGPVIYVTRGLDGCLFVMHLSEVEALCQKLRALPLTLDDARSFNRLLLSGALCELDRRHRFVVPAALRAYAGLHEHIVLVGVLNRVEIWSQDNWAQEIAYIHRQSHTSSAELISRGI